MRRVQYLEVVLGDVYKGQVRELAPVLRQLPAAGVRTKNTMSSKQIVKQQTLPEPARTAKCTDPRETPIRSKQTQRACEGSEGKCMHAHTHVCA